MLREVRAQFRLDWNGIHGAPHWARVYHHGQVVGARTGADLRVCELFAFLHDSRRQDDWEDPDHGVRAAIYAASLRERGYFEPGDASSCTARAGWGAPARWRRCC